MTKRRTKRILKGNRLWAFSYALSSLRTHKVRNIGIALILAISISIPTTVFSWTSTGTHLAVREYFDQNSYQFTIQNEPGIMDFSHVFDAQAAALESPFTESVEVTPSTVGILRIENVTPEWEDYYLTDMNYADHKKDCRVIAVSEKILEVWSNELEYEGNFSLQVGQILVSQRFVDTAFEVHGVEIHIGSTIGMDVLRHFYNPPVGRPFDPLELDRQILTNLTVVGIYDVVKPTVVSLSYPSILRLNWDPMGASETVLGLRDSVLILDEQLGPESVDEITHHGFFSPVGFIKGSADGLIAAGAERAAVNLLALKTSLEQADDYIMVIGLDNIENLQTHISTYLASQVLVVLALPIMIMSLMLTIFTSESSISNRKGEISALRAKGASFGQIFSGFMWESLILAFSGLFFGVQFSIWMAPLMGSSTGLLTFDPVLYDTFLSNLDIPLSSLALAGAIAMFLPASYVFHVSRRIDVAEIGQPTVRQTYEIPEEVNLRYYVLALGGTLTVLLLMPLLVTPSGSMAMVEILSATLLLFTASYLGSRAMRLVTADASERAKRMLGEKRLYLTQSLRRRKGQFIPLLVILTLTLTTTTMMLIQSASLKNTISNEMGYAIGADLRIEAPDRPLNWTDVLESYDGVTTATPVISSLSAVGFDAFYVEGVDAQAYLSIGRFKESSFTSGTPGEVLTALDSTSNGIVISHFYATLWNVTVGATINVELGTEGGSHDTNFVVVGVMRSAPGFGMASTLDLAGVPFGAYLGFQAGRGGFALANIEYVSSVLGQSTTDTFLVGTTSLEDIEDLMSDLSTDEWTELYTMETLALGTDSVTGLFLSGMQGLTMISFLLCAAMGLTSIVLFLGSAVAEREPEYALFRAIGGTKRQVMSLVFGEFAGSVIAAVLVSLGLGLLFGYTMTLLTFGISSVWPILPKVFTYPFTVMFITIAFECVAMILACYFPARRAGNTNPAEVLRNL
ncbi:MAG: FtsX-like permease family protein [Candidatus Thorarchaeota archaeon]